MRHTIWKYEKVCWEAFFILSLGYGIKSKQKGGDKKKMKKKMAVLVGIAVCAILLTSPVLASADTARLHIYGDANEDDTLDMRDVTYIKLVIFGKKPATTLADANYDGKISMLDLGQTKLIILDKEKKLTLVDNADRVVTVPRPIERIVAPSPDIVRLIIALGACDKLVGTAKGAKWCMCYYIAIPASETPKTKCAERVCGGRLFELPEVGESSSIDNTELVVPLKPDVIFGKASTADATQEKTGSPVVVISSSGHMLDKLYSGIENVGIVLGKEEEADELTSFVEEKVAKLEKVTSELSPDEKPKVYFATRLQGCCSPGVTTTTGHYEPINLAGGINVAEGISGTTVSKEQIIIWDPDMFLIVRYRGIRPVSGDPKDVILLDPDLQTLRAVKTETLYYTSYAYCYGRPQDKNLAAAFYMAKLFHPEKFEDLDVEKEGNEIFERFLGVDGLYSEYADCTGWLREFLDNPPEEKVG
jgi:iron complex transport system substrate-binding protein